LLVRPPGGQGQLEGEHIASVVTGFHLHQLHEAVNQESSPDEQHQRHPDFRDDQQALHTVPSEQIE
jgi:hypothetical protein